MALKILLINPPGPFARAGSRWPHRTGGGFGYAPFPFWLASLASFLREKGFQVELQDCIARQWNTEQLAKYTKNFNPELVIVETSAPSYEMDLESLKELDLTVPVAAVGIHATALPEQHLKDGLDYAIRGEYELSVLYLANYVSGREQELPPTGVASKENPTAGIGPVVEDLDSLPFPLRDSATLDNYVDVFAFGRSVQMITSRGCVYNCSFCTEPLLYGRPLYRRRSPDNVCDEIEYIIKNFHPDEIYFDDSSFTNKDEHVLDICRDMKERNINVKWSCMADAKVLPSTLEAMAEAGCRAIKFGVESADREVLKRIPKHINLDDVKHTVSTCKKLGIKTHATFVFGLPGETKEKAKKTIAFALSLGSDTAQFSIATPYPGTRFYKQVMENRWLKKDDFSLWGSTAVIGYPDYSSEDIIEMCNLAVGKWQRQMVLKKPSSVMHYLTSAYKRGGITGTLGIFKEGSKALIKGLKWR